jgi:exopolysaccharide biosynthesis polyprenyl glycosylphosphotransferase
MNRRGDALFGAYKLIDLLTMSASFLLAVWISYHRKTGISLIQFFETRIQVSNILLFIILLLIWYLVFSVLGLYRPKPLPTGYDEILSLIKATTQGALMITLFVILFSIKLVIPLFLVTFWSASTVIVILSRLVLRSTLENLRRRGRNLRNVLIAGTNDRAIRLAQKIQSKPELGFRLIGFVDDNSLNSPALHEMGYSVVASSRELPDFLRVHAVDAIFIGLPLKSSYEAVSQIVACCEEQGVIVRVLSDLFDLKVAHLNVEHLDGQSMITIVTGNVEGPTVLIKHAFDFVASCCLLILFAPLFLIIALLIRITSPGPVFFIQERVGLNKRRFRMYKFRTMIHGAERKQVELENLNEADGPVFKIAKDPRITTIGRFLRKTSIDELPQLLNVIKGEMSLVGPRPLPLRDYEGFDLDRHRRRFSVRPGMTCLWQINGRSNLSFNKWMELDLEYIDKWSLSLDFKILAQTFPAVFKGFGAK